MAKKTSPALIGAFVFGAVVLFVAAALIWGSRTLFERKYEYICYFPGSVNGLTKGAPVKYRGVEIGVVTEIRIRYQQAHDDNRIPVLIEVWGKRLRELGGDVEPDREVVRGMIGRGLRARLDMLSIVTGVLYVSLDWVPGSPMAFAELPSGHIPEIPALPTEMEEATRSAQALLARLSTVDIKGMVGSISEAATAVKELVDTPEIGETLRRMPPLISAVRQLATELHADAAKAGLVIGDAHGAMASVRGTIDQARGVITPRAPLLANLSRTLSDIDKAAVAMRELADFLRRNPHALIAGTKPPGAEQ